MSPLAFPALRQFGWNADREYRFGVTYPNLDTHPEPSGEAQSGATIPARVTRLDRGRWTLITDHGERFGELRGRLRIELAPQDRPTVGDWVAVTGNSQSDGNRNVTIEAVLERTTSLVRAAVGKATKAQVLAANVDTVLVCVPGDAPANPRRLERQLSMVFDGGAKPVIVRTKGDLLRAHDDAGWIRDVAAGIDLVTVDSLSGDGLSALAPWLATGTTVVVVGPSGAGKSTLANALLGLDRLATGTVRDLDQRGRHTTSWRELVLLPSGALLIDTPGIRELALWDSDDGLSATFNDVEELAQQCRFSNCGHRSEPGCAIREAIDDGALTKDRFQSWQSLQREAALHARRKDARLAIEERKKFSALHRDGRARARP